MEAKRTEEVATQTAAPKAGWRIKTGFAIFLVSLFWPVLLPILPLIGLSAKAVATITGVMFVAAEVMLVAAAAIAGKDGFAYIKQRIFGLLKSYGPPQVVSETRYRIGLAMLATPLLFGFLSPYIGKHIPGLAEHQIAYAVAGDVLLLSSLLLLGGNFWDKLRALFIYQAVAVIPDKPSGKKKRAPQ